MLADKSHRSYVGYMHTYLSTVVSPVDKIINTVGLFIPIIKAEGAKLLLAYVTRGRIPLKLGSTIRESSQLAGNVSTTLANIPYKFFLCLKKCFYLMVKEHFKDVHFK